MHKLNILLVCINYMVFSNNFDIGRMHIIQEEISRLHLGGQILSVSEPEAQTFMKRLQCLGVCSLAVSYEGF